MTNVPPADRRTVSEARFRFVMIVFVVVWAIQALMLLGLQYTLTVRVERIEQTIGSSKSLPMQVHR